MANQLHHANKKTCVCSHTYALLTIVGNNATLGIATGATSISLTPIQTGTTALVGTTDGGKTIATWKCGPLTGATGLPAKYLPGSCKG